ncbi:MAG: hypothetical protein ACI9FR_000001, partial [Cryomorphaceae bacterium]
TLSVSAHFIVSFVWRSQVRQRWKRQRRSRNSRLEDMSTNEAKTSQDKSPD